MSTRSIDDAVEFESLPSVKFPDVGDKVVGDVIATREQQQRDFETREPLFWDDERERPRMQWVLTLRTGDGDLDWYLKPAAWAAVKQAVKESGGKLSQGGRLTGIRIEDAKPRSKGMSGAHQFRAEFVPFNPVDQAIDADD